jgi:hypothetical protein
MFYTPTLMALGYPVPTLLPEDLVPLPLRERVRVRGNGAESPNHIEHC